MIRNSPTKITLIILSSLFVFLVTEIIMRYTLADRLALHSDERNLTYRHDSELGWFPIENSKKIYSGSRRIKIEHNSRGFRDSEHVVSSKPRMMFLGDSFVWGYDVEKDERFTEKLRLKLPEWSIYNLGVSGYGTDQELLLLMKEYDYYRPDIVFIVFCTGNDDSDNTHNVVYNGYHKPYFIFNQGQLQLSGIPVPKSENYFLSNHDWLSEFYWFRLLVKAYFNFTSTPSMDLENPTPALIIKIEELVKSRGAQLIIGSTDPYPELSEFLSNRKIAYIDLSNSYRYPGNGSHWTPIGHSFVSEKIFAFLNQGGYLAINSQTPSSALH